MAVDWLSEETDGKPTGRTIALAEALKKQKLEAERSRNEFWVKEIRTRAVALEGAKHIRILVVEVSESIVQTICREISRDPRKPECCYVRADGVTCVVLGTTNPQDVPGLADWVRVHVEGRVLDQQI